MQDLLRTSAREDYSEYYLAPGLMLYEEYSKTGNESYFNLATVYLKKGLELFPEHKLRTVIKTLLKKKTRIYLDSYKKLKDLSLRSVAQDFHHINAN